MGHNITKLLCFRIDCRHVQVRSRGVQKLTEDFILMVMNGEAGHVCTSQCQAACKSDRCTPHKASMKRLEQSMKAIMQLPHYLAPSLILKLRHCMHVCVSHAAASCMFAMSGLLLYMIMREV